MSSEEARTNELLRDEIRLLIDAQDKGIKIKGDKKRIIESMVAKLEASGMEPDHISREIKRIIKENDIEVSEDTIEKVLPSEKKRAHKEYETVTKAQKSDKADFCRPVTLLADGSTATATDEPDKIPLSADKGKGVVVTTEEDDKPSKVLRIVMSAHMFNLLGADMLKKVKENGKDVDYAIEYSASTRELFTDIATKGEKRDIDDA